MRLFDRLLDWIERPTKRQREAPIWNPDVPNEAWRSTSSLASGPPWTAADFEKSRHDALRLKLATKFFVASIECGNEVMKNQAMAARAVHRADCLMAALKADETPKP